MKNIFLKGFLCGIAALTWSCATEQHPEEIDTLPIHNSSDISLRGSFGDGEYEVLGRGYDITGNYLHPKSVRYQVLDINKYKQEHKGRIVKDIATWGEDAIFSGYSSVDYTNDVSKQKKLGASITGDSTKGAFTGNISRDITTESKYAYSSKYSYASVDVIRNHQIISINDKLETLKGYLDEDFLNDLNKYSADYIVENYGTHVITNLTLGGHYRLLYRSTTGKIYSSEMKTKIVESGLGAVVKGIGLNLNSSRKLTTNTSLTEANEQSELFVEFYGGNGSGVSFNLDKQQPTQVDLEKWENQIAIGKMSLTELDWNKTYPIYDLIDNTTKKRELKDAVARYKKKKEIIILDVVPLIEWRSNKERNHIFSIDPNYKPGYGNRPDYFLQDRAKCYVLKERTKGSVPLYQWYSSKELNYIYTADPSHVPGNGTRPDYSRQGHICYVYDKPADGTIPMYQYYSWNNLDYFYTTDPNKKDLGGDWVNHGIVFHVFPQ